MAKLVYTNCKVSISSASLSDHVESVTINYLSEVQDTTCMNSAGFRQRLGGLKDWNASINFRDDFAASSVNATIFAAIGTNVAVSFFPVNTSVAATNPNFNGNGIVGDMTLGGTVGAVAGTSVNIQGNGILNRTTA
jgi:predicted secreted protein